MISELGCLSKGGNIYHSKVGDFKIPAELRNLTKFGSNGRLDSRCSKTNQPFVDWLEQKEKETLALL